MNANITIILYYVQINTANFNKLIVCNFIGLIISKLELLTVFC